MYKLYYQDMGADGLTKCCDHIEKYGEDFIYLLPDPNSKPVIKKVPHIVWILKEKKTNKVVEFCTTRSLARFVRNHMKYFDGFDYKPLVIVKGVVIESFLEEG